MIGPDRFASTTRCNDSIVRPATTSDMSCVAVTSPEASSVDVSVPSTTSAV